MGNLILVWSPVQLRLANQSKVFPIGRPTQVPVEIEGLQTYAYFEVIDIFDDMNSYPVLVEIDWAIDHNQTIINFKKRILTFEDKQIRVVAPLDPLKGQRYVEHVNNEGKDGYLDHIQNITSAMDDYLNPTSNKKLSW